MRHKVDFSQARGARTSGVKAAHIVAVESKTSQHGNQYLNWTLLVHPDENFAWVATVLVGPGSGRLQALLKAVGVSVDSDGSFDDAAVLGKVVSATVEVVEKKDQNNNVKQNYEVKLITAPNSAFLSQYKPMSFAELEEYQRKDSDISFP